MTKEEHIEQAVASMLEVPSTTRVKGWVFKFMDSHYLAVCYWLQTRGDCIQVLPSNKRGKRTSDKHLVDIPFCKDPIKGIEALADLLFKEPSNQ